MHSAKAHGKGLEKLLKCDNCDFRTARKEKLLLHSARKRCLGSKRECDLCDFKTRDAGKFLKHQRSHKMKTLKVKKAHSAGGSGNKARFSDYQLKELQKFFETRSYYAEGDDLENLCKLLGLGPKVIKVWFMNARKKANQSGKERKDLGETEPMEDV